MANQIGDSKPVVGGYSTAINTHAGQGCVDWATQKSGKSNPGNTKPPKAPEKSVKHNAGKK